MSEVRLVPMSAVEAQELDLGSPLVAGRLAARFGQGITEDEADGLLYPRKFKVSRTFAHAKLRAAFEEQS